VVEWRDRKYLLAVTQLTRHKCSSKIIVTKQIIQKRMQYKLEIISTNNICFDREQVHFYILYMLSSLQCSVREKSERKIIVLEGSCAKASHSESTQPKSHLPKEQVIHVVMSNGVSPSTRCPGTTQTAWTFQNETPFLTTWTCDERYI